MSWSRNFSGTPAEVQKRLTAAVPEIEVGLTMEHEREEVKHIAKAAEILLVRLPPEAKTSLSISGHGYKNSLAQGTDTTLGGGAGISLSYSLSVEGKEAVPA